MLLDARRDELSKAVRDGSLYKGRKVLCTPGSRCSCFFGTVPSVSALSAEGSNLRQRSR